MFQFQFSTIHLAYRVVLAMVMKCEITHDRTPCVQGSHSKWNVREEKPAANNHAVSV